MIHNSGNIQGVKRVAKFTRLEEMEAFDQLPRELRNLINEGPISVCAASIMEQARQFRTLDGAAEAVRDLFNDFLAKPREETGWPSERHKAAQAAIPTTEKPHAMVASVPSV